MIVGIEKATDTHTDTHIHTHIYIHIFFIANHLTKQSLFLLVFHLILLASWHFQVYDHIICKQH